MSCKQFTLEEIPFIVYGSLSDTNLDNAIKHAIDASAQGSKTYKSDGVAYYSMPAAFDIETTSFRDEEGNKAATMWVWQFGLNGRVFYGRTWTDFQRFMKALAINLRLFSGRRLIVYVHNLAFEWAFINTFFHWDKVFAMEERKPIQAISHEGFEFRCSQRLSGYSLQKVGENLTKYKVQKLKGDLDYRLMRHTKSPITEAELKYCVNDVLVLNAYIQELIEENNGNITELPLTNTGFVRNYCRNMCFYGEPKPTKENRWKAAEYLAFMQSLTLTSKQYMQMRRAFQGGMVHANVNYSGQLLHNVTSFDICSSYPSVMLSELYPMTAPIEFLPLDMEQFEKALQLYCCIFDAEFTHIRPRVHFEHILSLSHCWDVEEATLDNGRIMTAKTLKTTLTELDYDNLCKFYEWDSMKIANMHIMHKAKLPEGLRDSVIDLYLAKTTLKGVAGKEVEYQHAKGQLNSLFGMCVTDIVRPEFKFGEEGWTTEECNIEEQIKANNASKKRFLYYAWGVWITAHARHRLCQAILAFGDAYVYSDTDSVKILNDRENSWGRSYLEADGQLVSERCEHLAPKDRNGIEHPLGVWDCEGTYQDFKTLGAKRYLVRKNGKLALTCAGLSKKTACKWLENTGDPFGTFEEGMLVPAENTGKLTHTYIDGHQHGTLIDYRGVPCNWEEMGGVHLEPATFLLTLSADYKQLREALKCSIFR